MLHAVTVIVQEITSTTPSPLGGEAEIIRSPLIIREALKEAPVTVPEGFERGAEAFVIESLSVTPVIQTDLLKIVYRNADAPQAKDLTVTLVQKYREFVQRSDRGRYGEDLELLTKREVALRGQLEQLQDEYTEFRSASPLIGQGRETLDVAVDQLAHVGRRLGETRNRRIELEHTLRSYAMALKDGPPRELLPTSRHVAVVVPKHLISAAVRYWTSKKRFRNYCVCLSSDDCWQRQESRCSPACGRAGDET